MYSVFNIESPRRQSTKNSTTQSLAVGTDANGVTQVEMARRTIDAAMIRELSDAFEALNGDPAVKAIVLCGTDDVFSADIDLSWPMCANQIGVERNIVDARAFARMLWLIESSPKPTIARVHGVVAGGGIGLVCACEITVAADDAIFSVTEAHSGNVLTVMRPYLLSAVGTQQFQRLTSSGTRINAQQACKIGLIQTVVPKSDLDTATKALGAFLGGAPMRRINLSRNPISQHDQPETIP